MSGMIFSGAGPEPAPKAAGFSVADAFDTVAPRVAARGLVVGATVFNFVLCFVATRGVPVGLPIIAGCELLLVGGALLLSARLAVRHFMLPGLLIALNLLVLALLAPQPDVKVAIDVAIVVGFTMLGYSYGEGGTARVLLFWLAVCVLAVGCYEMFLLPSFEHYFHVYDYYVGKGDLDAAHAADTGTTLAENGVRPEDQGRQLLPGLLGLHRVGSVFLEPVSAGNFSAICMTLVFVTRDRTVRGLLLFGIGLAIGILADARFAIFSAAAIAAFVFLPLWRSRLLVALLPVAAVAFLMVLGGVSHHEVDNSVMGRLTGSGALLDDWTIWRWFGVAADRQVSLDTGYSYMIGNLGVVASLVLWVAACVSVPRRGATARLFAAAVVYVALSLCVSTSSLSIKTGAILWFCLGGAWRDETISTVQPRPALAGRRAAG
jgi:putative polymerase